MLNIIIWVQHIPFSVEVCLMDKALNIGKFGGFLVEGRGVANIPL